MITFYEDIRNGNLSGVTRFIGSPEAQAVNYSDLNFKSALQAAIVNQYVDVVRAIIALPSFQRSLTAKHFDYISMAILSEQYHFVAEFLAIPHFYAQREQFNTTHTLELLLRDILNAGYSFSETKAHQRLQLNLQQQQKAMSAFRGLQRVLEWTKPEDLKTACESHNVPFAKLTMITDSQALWSLMPVPSPTDSPQYQQVYYAMDAILRNKLLAHRMEIDGPATVTLPGEHALAYAYNGSAVPRMICEMQKSFMNFAKSHRDAFETILLKNHIAASVIDEVAEDIAHIDQLSNGALYLPVPIQAGEPHVVAVSLYLDLCIIADRGNPSFQGARVFKVAENALMSSHDALVSLQHHSHPSMTYDQLLLFLKERLSISDETVDAIPFSAQFSGNCAWSSCAKMMPFSAFYFRVYQAVLAQHQDEKHALQTANKVAKACYRVWSLQDQLSDLKNYLDYYQQVSSPYCGPDRLLLAKIYLISQKNKAHQQRILILLKARALLTEDFLERGEKALLLDIKTNLDKLYQHAKKRPPEWLSAKLSDTFCKILMEIFLNKGKKHVLEVCQYFMLNSAAIRETDATAFLQAIREQFLTHEKPSKGWFPSLGIENSGKNSATPNPAILGEELPIRKSQPN